VASGRMWRTGAVRLGGLAAALAAALAAGSSRALAEWKPVEGKIMTQWAQQVSPDQALPEYPRPTMVRKDWRNLNGLWDYAIRPKGEGKPEKFDGRILVPYPIESALSGVGRAVTPDRKLWYRRTFVLPAGWKGQRVLLHFGAVDWEATVWVNGREMGSHRGGYDAFTFEITEALKGEGEQEVVVGVWDPTDAGQQARGKQVLEAKTIWYTAVTGIWQTAWLEPVPQAYLAGLRVTPDIDKGQVEVRVSGQVGAAGHTVAATALSEGKPVAEASAACGAAAVLKIEKPRLWSPDTPFLYDLKVVLKDADGKSVDEVSSYFGMRKMALGKDDKGVLRLCLNNQALFQYGPLDQGWWPDGLYTAPTDEALRYDVEVLKKIGCNMLRKHVKVEPARFYYWCDKLGMMVWQDMPSGDAFVGRYGEPDIVRTPESARQFEAELKALVEGRYNQPSIVMWVPFNEGWGQYDTARITELMRGWDRTRLVNSTSGWADRGTGDVSDVHEYPGPGLPTLEAKRAAVLGEFGGLGLPIAGHTWQDEKNWGYRQYGTPQELSQAYQTLLKQVPVLIAQGLSAAVYTQTTDVEIEVNGWLTYDRAVLKMDAGAMAEVNRRLYQPAGSVRVVVLDARGGEPKWRRVEAAPGPGWEKPQFNDKDWGEAAGAFGAEEMPATPVRTKWTGREIWLRRSFELPKAQLGEAFLTILYNGEAEVYVNGRQAAVLDKNSGGGYQHVALSDQVKAGLKAGANTLAVHARQEKVGYIDVGLVEWVRP